MPDRYKQEIEEILRQAGEIAPAERPAERRTGLLSLAWRHFVESLGGKTWSISPGRVMLTAIALLLSALIARAMVPGLVGPLAWGGLILFIVGYGMFFVRAPKNTVERRWRGQPLDTEETWWDRFRRRIK